MHQFERDLEILQWAHGAEIGHRVARDGGAALLPGLIDCHTHLGSRADRYYEIYDFKSTPFDHAFSGVVNARKTLETGVTTVRDLGARFIHA